MSYELAIWEGPAPLSNAHAASDWERRLAERTDEPPTPVIRALVDGLLAVHPDLDQPDGEESPWGDGPLLAYADGGMLHLPVQPAAIDDVLTLVEKTAADLRLVAFDPQLGELVPSATSVARWAEFELPSAEELPIHLTAIVREALAAPGTMAGILEQVDTGFYVQWMTGSGALVIEAQGEGSLGPLLRLDERGRGRMATLGFTAADPNWRQEWVDGEANVEAGAQLLSEVLTDVRALPPGTPMALQTFPV